MAFLSGADEEYSRPLRGDVPGCRSMAIGTVRGQGSNLGLAEHVLEVMVLERDPSQIRYDAGRRRMPW